MQTTVRQAASRLLMVQPVRFCYNTETAVDNAFQKDSGSDSQSTQAKALEEFNHYAAALKKHGVEAICFEDTPEPHKPDSIFPNNWISFHEDGTLVLYPMKATNRRLERRADIVEAIETKFNFKVQQKIDITKEEESGRFLEGTGSIVFDYVNKIAYACISQRTDKGLLEDLAGKLGYKACTFRSVDENGKEIYHTNVMMCVAEKYALVCAESIPDEAERETVLKSLKETGHEIVLLSYQQIGNFAGNALQVCNKEGNTFLIISKTGYDALTEDQKRVIRLSDEIIPVSLENIETNGGGSARCMIADIRLPKNE